MAKTEPITIRLAAHELAIIDACAVVRECSRREAIMHYLRLGMSQENAMSPSATKSDFDALRAELSALKSEQQATAVALFDAIKNQPIAIQETAPTPALPEPGRKLTLGERLRGRLD